MAEFEKSGAHPDHYTTVEVARQLGLAVRSVQMMVDRGELEAWKTAGGHRRISRDSVVRWRAAQTVVAPGQRTTVGQASKWSSASAAPAAATRAGSSAPRVLLIEDSAHYQNLVTLLVGQRFPEVSLAVASDGLAGLAMYGKIEPDVLLVDILLPGIDGASLITTLRSHPQFSRSRLIVITSLDEERREPYAFALQGVTVIHKPQLVTELAAALAAALSEVREVREVRAEAR